MRFNSVRTGDYSQSAKAVTSAADQIFDASRASAPDFTKISEAAIKGRSLERRTATEAEGRVALAGIDALRQTKKTRIKVDTDKEVSDIKRPAKRMAGIVAGLGAISQAALMNKNLKEDKAERDALRSEQNKIYEMIQDSNASLRTDSEALVQQLTELTEGFKTSRPEAPPKPDGLNTNTSDSSSSSSSSSNSGSGSSSGSSPTTVKPTSTKGFRSDVYNYLTQHHKLSKNKALGLMANIDRESSFRINPQGGDNGNSFGMFQWNNTYGRSQRMKKNVSDWQTNWKGQIDYALGGNQLPEYNKVTADFKNTTFETPQQAADYWMQHWERPAHQKRDSARHTEILSGYNF